MGRPMANEMVRLRNAHPVFPGGTLWKVTARYVVGLGPGKGINCVRVHAYCNPGMTLHFTEEYFAKLFDSADDRRRRRAPRRSKP